jgi:hypothetical protein
MLITLTEKSGDLRTALRPFLSTIKTRLEDVDNTASSRIQWPQALIGYRRYHPVEMHELLEWTSRGTGTYLSFLLSMLQKRLLVCFTLDLWQVG